MKNLIDNQTDETIELKGKYQISIASGPSITRDYCMVQFSLLRIVAVAIGGF
jgi:hypothetical protein